MKQTEQNERREADRRLRGHFARSEGFVGLLLGALSVCALLWLLSQAEGRLLRIVEASRMPQPARTIEAVKQLPLTSTVSPPSPAFDHDGAMKTQAENVVEYTMRASLDPARHLVVGESTIVFRNRSRKPVTELWFHLYLNAFKNERTLFARSSAPTGPRGNMEGTGQIEVHELVAKQPFAADLWKDRDRHSPGDPDDETDIRIPLPEPIPEGGSLTLEVRWEARLPKVSARTGYSSNFHMVAQWFPKLARLGPDGRWAHFPFHRLSEFFSDFGRYDVTLEVPEGYVVGATGPRVETVREGGKQRLRHLQDSVHDFAWVAWDGFREREEIDNGVTIRALYPPGYEAVIGRQIETAKFGLRRFGQAFGAYPYSVLTIVHPPAGAEAAGGMEYPTLITTGGPSFSPRGLRSIEHLTLHELGHQYFYGLVATDEHAWPFLDEGLDSYVESLFLAERFGKGSFLDLFGLEIGVAEGHRIFAIERRPSAPVAQPAPDFANGTDYAALVYSRTATILQTIARVYGEDELLRALGRYSRRYRFEHPGLEELMAALRPLGSSVEQNLRVALLERGFVDYRVDEASSEPVSTKEWQGSALVTRRGNLSFPVEIELVSQDGKRERVQWDGHGDSIRIPYRGESPLASVTVDPDTKVFLDEDLFNNSRRAIGRQRAPRVLERLGYFAQVLLQGAMP